MIEGKIVDAMVRWTIHRMVGAAPETPL